MQRIKATLLTATACLLPRFLTLSENIAPNNATKATMVTATSHGEGSSVSLKGKSSVKQQAANRIMPSNRTLDLFT